MFTYLFRKVAMLPVVLLAVSLLIFSAVRQLPGDPARVMAGPQATQEAVDAMHERLGLGRPFAVQYQVFLSGALRGDLGESLHSKLPVTQDIAERLPYTAALALTSYLFAILVGLSTGIFAAIYRGSWFDHVAMILAILGASVANFWLALMALTLFSVQLGWLPLLGADSWKSYILPSVTLGVLPAALIARMTRASMLENINQDYVRTARAKGLGSGAVYLRHTLRNALIPIVTIVGLNFGGLLGGAVITETVFNWPGLGRLLVDAVRFRDYAVIQGVTLLTVIIVVSTNLLVDVLLSAIDPRIRFE